ncbi:MAG: hypothetical protein AAFR61_14410 [Bacteroidota bacterium]
MSRIPFYTHISTACIGALLGSLFLLVFVADVTAQSRFDRMDDVIETVTGETYRGRITRQEDDGSLHLELVGGSILVLKAEEITQRRRELSRYTRVNRRYNSMPYPIMVREKGWVHAGDFQLSFGEGRWGPRQNPGFHYELGRRLIPALNIGVGLGFDVYQGGTIVPFFGSISGDLTRNRITPHYFFRAGYGQGVSQSWNVDVFQGGFTGSCGIGVKRRTRSKLEWAITLGYNMQQAYEEELAWLGGQEPQRIARDLIYQGISWQLKAYF